jgi:NADH:ubiquinone oxidoreductase subunit 5 (subunit L)/multisubunit Na+/H+ antiporter MnhA subunit
MGLIAWMLFFRFIGGCGVLFSWGDLGFFLAGVINFGWLECVFLFCLGIITLVVMVFGETYVMYGHLSSGFWATLAGFVLGIGVLIICGDWFLMLVGWEVLGITSYLLVSYYFTNLSSNGRVKTVLFNRVGDVFFVCLIGLCLRQGVVFVVLFVVIFSVCKSAQFPFSA